ncbi:hypothetical protein GCM10011501_18870 [Thalassotalea profundi]|uniref:Uncharacterized protein n=1 Tax=Thalassotalea profundi TaxID=2036687 RepID=A0ABQ3IRM8_9GAMM|nr:hypothetical protein GCM10011501_18870 [Thalassotalea profundi]
MPVKPMIKVTAATERFCKKGTKSPQKGKIKIKNTAGNNVTQLKLNNIIRLEQANAKIAIQ